MVGQTLAEKVEIKKEAVLMNSGIQGPFVDPECYHLQDDLTFGAVRAGYKPGDHFNYKIVIKPKS